MKSAWRTWNSFPEVTPAFIDILMPGSDLKTEVFKLLERFKILMFSPGSDQTKVGKLRKQFFTTFHNKHLDNMPLTRESLRRHTLFEQCIKVNTFRGAISCSVA